MNTRTFALYFGIIFTVVGIAGFIPGLVSPPHSHPEMTINQNYGHLFGLFPVNILHNLVHIAFGLWGFAAYRSHAAALLYARSIAIGYAALAVMGLIPGLQTLFGLVPLFKDDVWLHFLLAAIAAYFGFIQRPQDDQDTTMGRPH